MIDVQVKGTLPEINTDFSASMKEISELMYKSVRTNFEVGGRPAWPARKKSYPWPILRKNDHLYNSFVKSYGPSFAEVAVPNGVAEYAKYHQFGTRYMVHRMFMMFQDQDVDEILEIVSKNLIRKVEFTGASITPRSLA